MANEYVLIIDDNAMNLKLARVLLSTEGYVVKTASNAEEALNVLEDFNPKLILMDIQLPGMDGLELTRKLKADPKRKAIIVIALTAYAMKGDQEKALSAGCDAYVTKPIDINKLRVLLSQYFS